MNERAGSAETEGSFVAARSALAPWLAACAELEAWFGEQREAIWPGGAAAAQAEQRLALLHDTLEALARGNNPFAAPARHAAPRIDTLLAGKRATQAAPSPALAERRRKALLDLALWQALRSLQHSADGAAAKHSLARWHARLAEAAAPAPGLSPTLDFAQTPAARPFFEQSVRRVLLALADKAGDAGGAYRRALPTQPFDAGLPSLLVWSQAWSAAVAGVYLDYLHRHGGDDPQHALRELWSGRLDAVRFRAGPGLTALPTHAGALHLDLWTCAVKAQALAFDAARWSRQAQGTPWHGVRIDMHELSGPAGHGGVGIETLYRVVFIDRLRAALATSARLDGVSIDGAAFDGEHTIALEMDRPHHGHLPNLKLLLRWRDPSAGPLRFAAASKAGSTRSDDALQRWLAGQGQDSVAHALSREAIDWHGDSASDGATLGDGALWPTLDPGVQWIDPALVVGVGGAWYELPVELRDVGGERTAWALPADAALPDGLDRALLLRAAGAAGAVQWLATEAGLGAFVMAAIDVDAWRAHCA